MKKYILAIHNVKNMITSGNRLLYIVLFSIMVSVFGILFYSGYFLYTYYEDLDGSRITITLNEEQSGMEVWKLIESLEVEDNPAKQVLLLPDSSDLDEYDWYAEYNSGWEDNILLGTASALDEDGAVVTVPEYQLDGLGLKNGDIPIGMNITFQDTELEISGMVTITEYFGNALPVKYYALNYDTEKIIYIYEEPLGSEKASVDNLLSASGLVSDYKIKYENNPFVSDDFVNTFIQILLIFAAVIINVFVIAYYWIMHFKSNYCVYAICGADRNSILQIIFLQTCILMMPGIVLGNVLFFVFKKVICRYEIVYQGTGPYLGVSFVILLCLLLFCLVLAGRAVSEKYIYRTVE